jgi:hypothetical protein
MWRLSVPAPVRLARRRCIGRVRCRSRSATGYRPRRAGRADCCEIATLALWREPRQPSYVDSMPNLRWIRVLVSVMALAGFLGASWYLIGRQRSARPPNSVATLPPAPAVAPPLIPPQNPAVAPATETPLPSVTPSAAEPRLAIGIPMLPKATPPTAAPSGGAAPNLVTGLRPVARPADRVAVPSAPPPAPATPVLPTAPKPPPPPRRVATPPSQPASPPPSGQVKF